MIRSLLALAFLTASAFAGSQTLGVNDSVVYLDTPPPGATTLNFRVTSCQSSAVYGIEHLDSSSANVTAATKTLAYFRDGATPVLSQSVAHTPLAFSTSGYDGVLDYSGNSGRSNDETLSSGATSYAQYVALPSTLTLTRDAALVVQGTGYFAWSGVTMHTSFDVDWYWS